MGHVYALARQRWRRRTALAVKRQIDLVGALVLLLLLLPVLLLLSLMVLVDSGLPIIYSSRRYGCAGSVFAMYKFRTMDPDADERLIEVQHLNIADGNQIKIPNDPRRTSLGRVLSRTSLDELPNLVNVVRGEMSLIGPRPHTVQEYPEVTADLLARLQMRPGITGLWQVLARNHPAETVRAECDRRYIATWSLRLDAQVALRTVPAILRFRGGEPDLDDIASPDPELSGQGADGIV